MLKLIKRIIPTLVITLVAAIGPVFVHLTLAQDRAGTLQGVVKARQ